MGRRLAAKLRRARKQDRLSLRRLQGVVGKIASHLGSAVSPVAPSYEGVLAHPNAVSSLPPALSKELPTGLSVDLSSMTSMGSSLVLSSSGLLSSPSIAVPVVVPIFVFSLGCPRASTLFISLDARVEDLWRAVLDADGVPHHHQVLCLLNGRRVDEALSSLRSLGIRSESTLKAVVRLSAGAGRAGPSLLAPIGDVIVEADVVGAICCTATAASMLGLRVTKDFGKQRGGLFSGFITGFTVCEDFGGRILHTVEFDDGDIDEYSYDVCMLMHSTFLTLARHPQTPPAAFRGSLSPAGTIAPVAASLGVVSPPARLRVVLPTPASFENWPFHFSDPDTHQSFIGFVVERVIEPNGAELWRVAVPAPHVDRWLTTAQLLKHIDIETSIAKDTSKPARIIPVARPFVGFAPVIDDVHWTRGSAFVGHVVTVSLSNMSANWKAERDRAAATAPTPKKSKGGKPPIYAVTIEAVFIGSLGSPVQCIGRCHHDSTRLVFFPDLRDVSEGSFAHALPKAGWGRTGRSFISPLSSGPEAMTAMLADCSLNNPNFLAALSLFSESMPSAPADLFQSGVLLMRAKIPKSCRAIFRESLLGVTRLLEANLANVAVWKLLLLFDGLILAPVDSSETTVSAIKRRLLLLRSGDWAKLLPELKFRTVQRPTPSPLSSDKQLASALRASAVLTRTRSRSGAVAALSAPLAPRRLQPGDLTSAFKKLNPVAGVDPFDDSGSPRRPLCPPLDVAPPAISFTVKEVLKNVRRANKAAAGGPSGSDYLTLGTWFHADDALSLSLTRIINLIVAGKVPEPAVQLLIAGRGICIPKDEKGGLRPIVVGSVLLRLVGSLAIRKESAAINQYFLSLDSDTAPSSPSRPFQFGVGVQGGCELMASAIEAHLGVNPSSIVLSCDAANAFNSVCRSRLWGVLRAKFPSLFALVRMMYGSEASIVFSEEGIAHPSVVNNSVGTRQGCSLGSFIFALMIHPFLVILAKEFPSVLVLAYADDVSLVGSPEEVVACYGRWQELYGVELQGSLRDEKGVVYAQRPLSDDPPSSTLGSLLSLGLPCEHVGLGGVVVPGIKVVHDGLRVLGAPVGSSAFKLAFALARVKEVVLALETAALMPELQLQHCISAGSLIHRINHLLRNIPGGDRFLYQDIMIRYDTAVIDAARRVARQTMLPLLAQRLASLPARLGGLGYRTWAMTADAAFLAKYVHVSRQFKSLFPALCSQFPDVLSLGSESLAKAISPNVACAFRALSRIEAGESVVGVTRSSLLRDQDRPLRHLQHVLASISEDSAHVLVTEAIAESDDPAHPRHMAVHLSHCGDPTTLSMVPTCPATTFSNDQFEAVTNRRLLLPIYTNSGRDCLTCLTCGESSAKRYGQSNFPRVDVFGDHALRCHHGSRLRIKWHDGIVCEFAAAANSLVLLYCTNHPTSCSTPATVQISPSATNSASFGPSLTFARRWCLWMALALGQPLRLGMLLLAVLSSRTRSGSRRLWPRAWFTSVLWLKTVGPSVRPSPTLFQFWPPKLEAPLPNGMPTRPLLPSASVQSA